MSAFNERFPKPKNSNYDYHEDYEYELEIWEVRREGALWALKHVEKNMIEPLDNLSLIKADLLKEEIDKLEKEK